MTKETTINSVSSKPSVILTRKLPDDIETRMRELFNTTLNEDDEPFSRVQLIEAANYQDYGEVEINQLQSPSTRND